MPKAIASLVGTVSGFVMATPPRGLTLPRKIHARDSGVYFFFPLTFAPMRNNFRTVPVGRLFI
jgi:hypothetical protein